MKKIILTVIAVLMLGASAHAEETWKDQYVTRLMKLMTANPSYTDIALTDLDENGIPEAFLIKKGMNGGIKTGITYKDNVLVSIDVPQNVTGECLEDITVYTNGEDRYFVGKEIGRYTAKIQYYSLYLTGSTLNCGLVLKSDYSDYSAIPYRDNYGDDFYENNYPDREKLEKFIASYVIPTGVNVKKATAKVSVNGKKVDISGVFVAGTNYYKIRDVAMIMSTGVNRFSVNWDSDKNAISIVTGKKYTAVGGELSGDVNLSKASIIPIGVDLIVNNEPFSVTAYNIDGSNYFKIRDLADLVGFSVGWDDATGTVTIENE